jgi:hypothetical protein
MTEAPICMGFLLTLFILALTSPLLEEVIGNLAFSSPLHP